MNAETVARAFASLRDDFTAAKQTRFRRRRTGLAYYGSGADYHYRWEGDFLRMMEYARDMDRNDAITATALNRCATQIVQDGFLLQPTTGSEDLDAALLARWQEWGSDAQACDYAGVHTWNDIEWITLRTSYVDGDVLMLPVADGSIQQVEAHRLRTPRQRMNTGTIHGIELDGRRRRVRYWVTVDDLDPLVAINPTTRFNPPVPGYDDEGNPLAIHVADPLRFTQTRGVTIFAPLFDHLGMFEDTSFAKLVQSQMASAYVILHLQKDLDMGSAGTPGATGEQTQVERGGGFTQTSQATRPGLEYFGAPGEDLVGFAPNIPNPEWFKHVKLILSIIGARLGLPYIMLLLDASETNFSGWRGAVDIARAEFRRTQKWLTRKLHRPVYTWKVRQWLATDDEIQRLAAVSGVNPWRHKWATPGWPYIQPEQDAKADATRLTERLTSPRRLQAEKGRDFDEVAKEIATDNARQIAEAIAAADRVNTENPGAGVTWQQILNPTEAATSSTSTTTEEVTTDE